MLTRFGQEYPICFRVEFLIFTNPFITRFVLDGTRNMLRATSVIWFLPSKLCNIGSRRWLGILLHNSLIFFEPYFAASSASTSWHSTSKVGNSASIAINFARRWGSAMSHKIMRDCCYTWDEENEDSANRDDLVESVAQSCLGEETVRVKEFSRSWNTSQLDTAMHFFSTGSTFKIFSHIPIIWLSLLTLSANS